MYRHTGKETENQKQKSKFRRSKQWAEFREEMKAYQDGKDYITQGRLPKGWNLHHANLNPEAYEKLNTTDFFCLGGQCHDFIHWLYRYYRKDRSVIERLQRVLERMFELSEKENK